MKKISVENIICSLFLKGLKKIDVITIALIVSEIKKDKTIQLSDSPISSSLLNYINYNGFSYSIKENKKLNDNVLRGFNITLASELRIRTTKEISNYIDTLNFNQIAHNKIALLKKLDENLKSLFVISDVEQVYLDAELKHRDVENPSELILSKKKLK